MFITEIPLDVFLNICEFLNPLDVLSFGECTQQLHAFSKTRSLWISLTQQIIQSNSLYGPSFPIPKLTTRQLQQVACSPSRMIERFRNAAFSGYTKLSDIGSGSESGSGTRPYRINEQITNPLGANDSSPLLFPPVPMRVIHLPTPLSPSPPFMNDREMEFEKLCLIPGGRFLVATFWDEAVLFDLGAAGYTSGKGKDISMDGGNTDTQNSIPICARWKHQGDDFFMPGPSRDGRELRIAMGGSLNDDDELDMPMLSIVRIWEEEPDILARPQGSVHHNDNTCLSSSMRVMQHYAPLPPHHAVCLSFFTLVGDLFVYAYASEVNPHDDIKTNRIHVWNFVEDECVEWEIDGWEYKELFIDGEYVVMIAFPDIVGWKIPPLNPMNRRESSPTSSPSPFSPSRSIYTFAPTKTLPLYPPTFRIPLITNPNPHLTADSQSNSASSASAYSLSELDELNYNPLNDIDMMLIGRMLDWYNVNMKVRKFDAAFARGQYYGFLSYGVDGWPIEDDGGTANVDSDEGASGSMPSTTKVTTASRPIRRDPRIVLETSMYFKGDRVNGVGLVMDPFRVCEGYTIKNVVASDGRGYLMVHDQTGEGDEWWQELSVADGLGEKVQGLKGADGEEREGRHKSLADRLWTPKKVVTIELCVPGDDERLQRKSEKEDEDASQPALGNNGPNDDQDHNDGAQQVVDVSGEGDSQMTTVLAEGSNTDGEMNFGRQGGEASGSGLQSGSQGVEGHGNCRCANATDNRDDEVPLQEEPDDASADEGAGEGTPKPDRIPTAEEVINEWEQMHKVHLESDVQHEVLPSIPDEGRVRGRSDVSFDPCSGRFCFVDKARKMVGVVDYLRWG